MSTLHGSTTNDRSAKLYTAFQAFQAVSFPRVTPLRYPGAKQWLVEWAKQFFETGSTLVEGCAGGAVVSSSLLAAGLFQRVILIEKDTRVAAFWREALRSDSLARKVAKFRPTPASVHEVVDRVPTCDSEWAFWVYVKNRAAFNGVLDGGLSSEANWRFKIPGDLFQIRSLASKITFIEGDALEILDQCQNEQWSAFIDPPYPGKGHLLYREHDMDHRRLFEIMSTWRGRWVLTYEDCPEIRRLVHDHHMKCDRIGMRDGRHRLRHELVITRRGHLFQPETALVGAPEEGSLSIAGQTADSGLLTLDQSKAAMFPTPGYSL